MVAAVAPLVLVAASPTVKTAGTWLMSTGMKEESPPHTPHTPAATSRRWWVLVAVGVETFMSALDGSVVNTVLPVLRRDLHTSVPGIERRAIGASRESSQVCPPSCRSSRTGVSAARAAASIPSSFPEPGRPAGPKTPGCERGDAVPRS